MKSEYQSPNSVGKRPTIPIDIDDPRLENGMAGLAQSRSGGEVQIVDSSGYSTLKAYSIHSNMFNSNGSYNPTPEVVSGAVNTGTGGGVTIANAPLQVSNLVGAYQGDNIVLTFTFDTNDSANSYFSSFIVQVYNPNTQTYLPLSAFSTESLSSTSSSQTLTINPNQLSYTGLANLTVFTKVKVATFAAQYTLGYVESNTFSYTCDLPAPVITVSHSVAAYTVTITNFATLSAIADFSNVAIQEFVSTDSLAQVQAEDTAGTSVWNLAGPPTTTNVESFLAADGYHRWIRAYAYTKSGGKSPVSNYVDVTPDPINPGNLTAPNNLTSATAAWSGNNIVITFAQALSNPGASVVVKLVPVINGTVSSILYGTFTNTLVAGATSFTIYQQQLVGVFGQYYTAFQAHVNTISQQNVPSSGTIDIGTFSKTNTLSGITPTASIINAVAGYGVNFDLGTTGADYGEIYHFYQNPTFITSTLNFPDYMDATYQSGTGSSTLVVNALTYQGGAMALPSATDPTQYFGYQITGNGIPSSSNVFVSGITYNSSTQKYSLSLSYYDTSTGTLTPYAVSSASGSYHMQSLVYSGVGPASIYNTLYSKPLYVVVAYYTYGGFRTNNSYPTYSYLATPINPAQSVISNSVQIGSGGAIYVGASKDTGSRIVLGPSGNKGPDGSSAYSGIFAFDYGSTAGSSASTAIITNPGASSYTLQTTNALIANWAITTNNIQNLGSAGTYVGLSSNPSASYAIWAGSTTSGGDAVAKFTVSPTGQVIARKISIYGTGVSTDSLIDAGGGTFSVKGDGSVTASSATITGVVNINGTSTFGSNIYMDPAGIFHALGTQADGVTTATQSLGSSVQIRGGTYSVPGGLFAYDLNHNLTTWIAAKPILDKYTFQTKAALLGSSESTGWLVGDNTIQSGNGRIVLNASSNTVKVSANGNSNYGVVLSAEASADQGAGGVPTGNAIAAGLITSPNFTVDHTGKLTATGAAISGAITASSFEINSYNSWNVSLSKIFKAGTANTYLNVYGLSDSINMQTTIPAGYYVGSDGVARSQAQTQKISLGTDGLHINGLSVYGDDTRLSSISSTNSPFTRVIQYAPQSQTYGNTQINGGDAVTGFAIYYGSKSPVGTTGTGFSGDLWVQI